MCSKRVLIYTDLTSFVVCKHQAVIRVFFMQSETGASGSVLGKSDEFAIVHARSVVRLKVHRFRVLDVVPRIELKREGKVWTSPDSTSSDNTDVGYAEHES